MIDGRSNDYADYEEDPCIYSHETDTPDQGSRTTFATFPSLESALGDFYRLLPDPLENWLSPFVFASHQWEGNPPPVFAIDPDDWSFWFDNRLW